MEANQNRTTITLTEAASAIYGLTFISLLVRNHAGEALGALSISTHISQTTNKVFTTILPALKTSAKAIE